MPLPSLQNDLLPSARLIATELYIEGRRAVKNYVIPALKATQEIGCKIISFLGALLVKGLSWAKNDLPPILHKGFSIVKDQTARGIQIAAKKLRPLFQKASETSYAQHLSTHRRTLGVVLLAGAVVGTVSYAMYTAAVVKNSKKPDPATS